MLCAKGIPLNGHHCDGSGEGTLHLNNTEFKHPPPWLVRRNANNQVESVHCSDPQSMVILHADPAVYVEFRC